jgi:deoxyguanosine kinase
MNKIISKMNDTKKKEHTKNRTSLVRQDSNLSPLTPFFNIHSYYERLRHLRGAIILVEGIISSGKTSLCNALCKMLKKAGIPCLMLEEEVDPIMLDLFLTDMKQYAFTFQMLMLAQRQKTYMRGLEFARRENGVAIIDRSLHGDMAFCLLHVDRGNISDREWKAYESVMSSTPLPQPSNIIYLDVTPETALERIKIRNRGKEAEVYDISYLHDLDVNYRVAMEESQIPIHYIDWNDHSNFTDEELLDICEILNPHA